MSDGRRGRAAAAPLPPGWDEAVDLERRPGDDPGPRRGRGARRAARRDRGAHGALPRPPLGDAAGARRRAGVHGWCSPEAIRQVAAVMQVTPAYLSLGRDLLRHAAHRARRQPLRLRLHERRLPPAQREAVYDAIADAGRRAGPRGRARCASSSASAPATWRRWRRSTAATSGPLGTTTRTSSCAAVKRGEQPFPGRGLGRRRLRAAGHGADPPGPPAEPDVHPAGGTWKDAAVLDVPEPTSTEEGHAPHREPLDPGSSRARSATAIPRRTRTNERDARPAREHRRARPQHDRRLRAPRRLRARCARRCSR